MSEPVTIGSQTFIKSGGSWVDKKTKAKAPDDLIALLNKMQQEFPENKKTKVKIDTTRQPVVLGDSEYVWDLNGKVWIDKKTKVAANPRFSVLIEAAYNQATSTDFLYEPNAPQPTEAQIKEAGRKAIASAIMSSTGTVGQAAKSKTKKTTGQGTLQFQNKKINSPIVTMIEKLAAIDGYLKQRLQNQKLISDKNVAAIKEQAIEQQKNSDAVLEGIDGKKVENKKSPAAMAAVAGIAALIAYQFDPVKDAIAAVVDAAKNTFSFISGFVDVLNNGLKFAIGNKAAVPAGTVTMVEPKDGGRAELQVKSGYGITKPTESGNRYVYKIGSDVGYKVNVNPETKNVSIDYNKKATISYPGRRSSANPTSSPVAVSSPPSTSSRGSMGNVTTSTSKSPTQNATPSSPPQTKTHGLQAKSGKTSGKDLSGDIPKNDIVALANYLIGKGADKSQMENMLVSGRVGEHSPNSRHKKGTAIDVNFPGPNEGAILDNLEPKLRALGYNTIWRKPGHYTHMHVSVGPPEGYGPGAGDYQNDYQRIGSAGLEGLSSLGRVIKAVGSEFMTKGTYYSMAKQTADNAEAINKAQLEKVSAIVESKSTKSKTEKSLPNLNAGNGDAPVQNPATQADRSSTLFYIQRQGLAVA